MVKQKLLVRLNPSVVLTRTIFRFKKMLRGITDSQFFRHVLFKTYNINYTKYKQNYISLIPFLFIRYAYRGLRLDVCLHFLILSKTNIRRFEINLCY